MNYPQQPNPDPNAGLRRAGTAAIWVWVLISLIPIALIIICIMLCFSGMIINGVHPTPTPS